MLSGQKACPRSGLNLYFSHCYATVVLQQSTVQYSILTCLMDAGCSSFDFDSTSHVGYNKTTAGQAGNDRGIIPVLRRSAEGCVEFSNDGSISLTWGENWTAATVWSTGKGSTWAESVVMISSAAPSSSKPNRESSCCARTCEQGSRV